MQPGHSHAQIHHEGTRVTEPAPNKRNYTAAADELGVSRDWLRKRVWASEVPHHRIAGRVYFDDDDMKAIWASFKVVPAAVGE